MKNHLISSAINFIVFFILLFLFTKISGPLPFSVNSVTTTKNATFDVTGTGKASVKPDIATVQAGVSSSGPTTAIVQEQMNISINKISAAIKNLGIDPKDIQTSNYNVNPVYDYTLGQKITGYSANTNLTIKVRDINKTNQVIDVSTTNGATNVTSLGFSTEDQSGAENEARKIAVSDAKKKAENAAKIVGFTLGKIINYSESFGGNFPRPVALSTENKTIDSGTNLETGTNEINITITLSYEIR